MKMKRICACLLCLLMLLGAIACGNDTQKDTQTTTSGQSSDTTTGETTTTEAKETLDIPDTNYNTTFNILMTGNWKYNDFEAENIYGEPINDARYQVNSMLKDLYGITVAVKNDTGVHATGAGNGFTAVQKQVTSGSKDYDLVSIGCYDVATLAYSGYLYDLNTVENVNLSKSWYNQKCVEQLAVGGRNYFITGDAMTLDNDCTYCILFNKTVRTDNKLEDPYTLVKNNQWTFDKFLEMINACGNDLNGDGQYTADDAYGAIVWTDSIIGMLHASGGRFATISEDGKFSVTLDTERNINVMTAWINEKETDKCFFNNGGTSEADHAPFTENRCLFYTRYIKAAGWFRDSTLDFGILPYPKWDNDQSEYNVTMHAYGTSYLAVPAGVNDSAMSGAMLEALSYYGQEYLTPAYYDTTLIGKSIRDEESAEMLDIIFASRFYDIGTFYQIGGLNETVNTMMRNGATNFSSVFKAASRVAKSQIDKISVAFDAIK